MKVIDPGHRYELESLDGDAVQTLTFVKREGQHYPGNVGSYPGTTMQEVIRALLERARYVYRQIPCLETEGLIQSLQHGLLLCEIRAKRVKGGFLPQATLDAFEAAATCNQCGHVSCNGHSAAPREEKK